MGGWKLTTAEECSDAVLGAWELVSLPPKIDSSGVACDMVIAADTSIREINLADALQRGVAVYMHEVVCNHSAIIAQP